MRSRAVSLPALCSRSRRSAPPPASASSEIRRSSAMRSRCLSCGIRLGLVSANGASLDGGFLRRENAHGKVCGNPRGSEKQNNAKEHFRTHGKGALQGRLERSHIFGCANENEHRPEGQRYDQHGGESGGKDHFHGSEYGPLRSGMKKDNATGGKAERRRSAAAGIANRIRAATPNVA